MGKALGLVAALALLAAPAANGAAGPSGKLIASAEETVLRLHDLPPGYQVGGESGCEAVEPTGIPKLHALDEWTAKSRPAACDFEYDRHFQVPGSQPAPPFIDADVIAARSAEDAAVGIQTLRGLIGRMTRFQPHGTVSIFPGGPTASLFRHQEGEGYESSLLWQYGRLIAAVEVSETSLQGSDEAALYYAQAQQRRLESPSPYTEAERDDSEVELDDPNLRLPVYWLGSTFEPGNGFSPAKLWTATAIEKGGLPGVKLELRYDGFNLETWTEQSWKRFQESFFRKINHPRCTRTIAFEWEQGHAVLSAGYRRRTFEGGCPDFPPTRYWAAAHIGGVVVGVNQTTCRCLSPGFGPYSESLRGMKALLRSLVLRPKPVY
jgi:hypothetical protein